MKKKLIILFLLLLALNGCTSVTQNLTEKGYRELRGGELQSMVSDVVVDSGSWKDTFHADGSMAGTNSHGNSYSGKWQINPDGKLCIKSANQYINGCTKIFIHDKSNKVAWIEADGTKYNVTLSKAP